MVSNGCPTTAAMLPDDAYTNMQPPAIRRVAPIGVDAPAEMLAGQGARGGTIHQGLIDRLSVDLDVGVADHDARDDDVTIAAGDDEPIGTQLPVAWHEQDATQQVAMDQDQDTDGGFSFPAPLALTEAPLESTDSTNSTASTVVVDDRGIVPPYGSLVSPLADLTTAAPVTPSLNPYTTKMLSYDSEIATEPLMHPSRTRGAEHQLFVHYETHAYDVNKPVFNTRVYASVDPQDASAASHQPPPPPPPLCIALVIDVSPSMTDVLRSDGLVGSALEPQSASRTEHTLLAYAKRAARKTVLDLQKRARSEGRPTEVAVFVFSTTVRALCSEAREDMNESYLTTPEVGNITPRQLDPSEVEWFDVHDDASVERLFRALDCVNTTGSSGTNISNALGVAGAYMTSHMLHTSKMITDLCTSTLERDHKRRIVSYDDVLTTSKPEFKHGAIVLLTDGEANQGVTSGEQVAWDLHAHAIGNMPISVSAIALGEHVNHVFINELLGDGHRFAFARNGSELLRAFGTVLKTYDDHFRNVSITDVAIPSTQAGVSPSKQSWRRYQHVVRRHGSFQPSEEFSCLFTLVHRPVQRAAGSAGSEERAVPAAEADTTLVGHDLMRDRHAIYMAYGRNVGHTLADADVRLLYPFEVTCCGSEQQLEQAALAATTEHYLAGQSRLQDAVRRNDIVREVRVAIDSASTHGAEHSLSQLRSLVSSSSENVGRSWDRIHDMCTDFASRMASQVELEKSCASEALRLPSLNRQSTDLMCMETNRSFA